jgi:hypothetical protein
MSLDAAIKRLTELYNMGYKGQVTYNFTGTGIADAELNKQRIAGENVRLVAVG